LCGEAEEMSDKKLLKPSDIQRIYGISEGALYYWRTQGIGPQYIKLPRGVRYRVAALEKWLDSNTKKTIDQNYLETD
jgi:predicted DNA-binding transcriptional regulator AlpA